MTTDTKTARVNDMTQGTPMKLILWFAVPLFVGNIFQQVYSMVDTMVVGYHLGDEAIAAIGVTASLYSLLINFAGGLNNGYGIVVTQRFGAHEPAKMKQAIAGMMLLDGGAVLILTALSLIFLEPLMVFMNTPPELFHQADVYIRIIAGGMVTTIGYNMFAAILRAMGNSRTPLYFLILSTVSNVVLDVLFVMVLGMGIGGAAFATVLAQAVSALGCGFYLLRNYRDYLPGKEDFRVSREILSSLFSMGLSMALMASVVNLGSVIFQRVTNQLGQTIIAAHTASRKLLNIMLQPLATISVAASTFIGQNWGAKKVARIRSALKQSLLLEFAWGLISSVLIFLTGNQLIRFTTGTSDPQVIQNAVLSLRIHFAMFPILGVLFCIRNALQAMGYKLIPVLSSCIELGMKILSACFLIPRMGFLGTCITEPITWALMVAFLMSFYLSQRRRIFSSQTL